MKITKTKFDNVVVLEPHVLTDHRGFFMETFNTATFAKWGLPTNFVQDNHSLSVEVGTLRGLHYQLSPHAQTKLVRCVRGAILDVVVDIRRSSPTFKAWHAEKLTAENKKQLLVPEGFAHGFLTLEPNSEVCYKVTELYTPSYDRALRWNDPEIAIDWQCAQPIISEKDQKAPLLADAEIF